jgi:hypothetical protein
MKQKKPAQLYCRRTISTPFHLSVQGVEPENRELNVEKNKISRSDNFLASPGTCVPWPYLMFEDSHA